MVASMSRDRIHIPRFGLHAGLAALTRLIVNLATLDSDRDRHATFIQDFEAIKPDIEEVTPALRNVEEQALAAKTLTRLLDLARFTIVLLNRLFLLHGSEL